LHRQGHVLVPDISHPHQGVLARLSKKNHGVLHVIVIVTEHVRSRARVSHQPSLAEVEALVGGPRRHILDIARGGYHHLAVGTLGGLLSLGSFVFPHDDVGLLSLGSTPRGLYLFSSWNRYRSHRLLGSRHSSRASPVTTPLQFFLALSTLRAFAQFPALG
jgi:hypothetical protein